VSAILAVLRKLNVIKLVEIVNSNSPIAVQPKLLKKKLFPNNLIPHFDSTYVFAINPIDNDIESAIAMCINPEVSIGYISWACQPVGDGNLANPYVIILNKNSQIIIAIIIL